MMTVDAANIVILIVKPVTILLDSIVISVLLDIMPNQTPMLLVLLLVLKDIILMMNPELVNHVTILVPLVLDQVTTETVHLVLLNGVTT
jgi:hypothetical protein